MTRGVDAKVYEDYSGRFMYGQTCPGIVCDDPVAVGFAAAKADVTGIASWERSARPLRRSAMSLRCV
jgi:hypothetical protein